VIELTHGSKPDRTDGSAGDELAGPQVARATPLMHGEAAARPRRCRPFEGLPQGAPSLGSTRGSFLAKARQLGFGATAWISLIKTAGSCGLVICGDFLNLSGKSPDM
jgi:hypothetical protein